MLPPAYTVLNIVRDRPPRRLDPIEVARVHFALAERLGLSLLVARILALPRDDRWQTMARAALRDDLHAVHAQLTAQVLASTGADRPVPVRIADWEEQDTVVVVPRRRHPGGDLRRRARRPGPAVGRAPLSLVCDADIGRYAHDRTALRSERSAQLQRTWP